MAPGNGRIDAELRTDGNPGGAVALGVDSLVAAVLAGRGVPDDDIAAAVQMGHRRVALIARRVRVDPLLAVSFRRPVHFLRDVNGDDAARRRATVAIADPNRQLARSSRGAAAVAVAQVLNQRLHRVDGRVGVQVDAQIAAVHAAGKCADDHSAVGDGRSGNADLAGSGSLIAHAQLIVTAAARNKEQFNLSAGEVGRIEIAEAYRRVDHLQAGVNGVLAEGHAAAEVGQLRVGLAAEVVRVAEQLLIDAILTAVLAVGRPDGDVVAAPEISECRVLLPLVPAIEVIDALLIAERVARGIVLAQEDLVRAALGVVSVEADDKAAGRQADHIRLILVSTDRLIDLEFATDSIAVCVVALTVDAVVAAVLIARSPHDDEPAVRQHRHARLILVVRDVRIDVHLAADGGSVAAVALRINTRVAVSFLVLGAPDNHMAAVRTGVDMHIVLTVVSRRVDSLFTADRCAAVVVVLAIHPGPTAILSVRIPGDDKASAARTAVRGNPRPILVRVSVSIDAEVDLLSHSIRVVALPVDAPTAAICRIVRPNHHETTVRQADDDLVALRVTPDRVNPEFGAERAAVGVEALRENAEVAAILPTGCPSDDIATTGERTHRRTILVVRDIGIDALFAKNFHCLSPDVVVT